MQREAEINIRGEIIRLKQSKSTHTHPFRRCPQCEDRNLTVWKSDVRRGKDSGVSIAPSSGKPTMKIIIRRRKTKNPLGFDGDVIADGEEVKRQKLKASMQLGQGRYEVKRGPMGLDRLIQ
ncbi:hypothetical protein SLA2020_205880 [Shorea laevis]